MSERKVYRDGKLVGVDYFRRHRDGCATKTSYKAGKAGFFGHYTYGKPTRTTYTRPR